MLPRYHRAYAAVTALSGAMALWGGTGCVEDRPTRNGVFNENQYLRKDFLVAPGDGSAPDTGWFVKSTIVAATTPNILGSGAGLFAGAEGGGAANYVAFQITQDKLQLINLRTLGTTPDIAAQGFTTPEISNSWPITNVDLKYRINLDGEKTNFYEENQELDWQVRQWVKINFAKNDLSDLYAYGASLNPVIQNCTDLGGAAVTLVTDSFAVDTVNNTFEYSLNMTLPIQFSDANAATCVQAFGGQAAWNVFQQTGRQNIDLILKTVYARPASTNVDGTYVPLTLAEKDPIQRKYGPLTMNIPYRDPNSQLLGATTYVMRHNPNKPIVFYFAPGFPKTYQTFFVNQVAPGTNTILAKAGAKAKVTFLNYNDATTLGDGAGPVREYGDPRYNFLNYHSDLDEVGGGLLGVMQPFADPRTGELISASVNIFNYNYQDALVQRLDLFLQTVGAEYLCDGSSASCPAGEFDNSKYPATCTIGETIPLVGATVTGAVDSAIANNFNRQSTVYSKMQGYLQKPFAQYGYLGPADFLPTHDSDFYNAYYAVIPYQVYADPQANAFVVPEGSAFATSMNANWESFQAMAQFEQMAGQIDQGMAPYDVDGPTAVQDAVTFYTQWNTLAQQISDYKYTKQYAPQNRSADDIGVLDYFDVYQKNGRHCVMVNGAPAWESRASYTTNLIDSVNEMTAAHEFGHALGLDHNFMASVDQRNFPLDSTGKPTLYASSIMEYSQLISDAFYETSAGSNVWGSYDVGALGWIYGNNLSASSVGPVAVPSGMTSNTVSGQVSATAPWNDPYGFTGTTETPFLYCGAQHMRYTPLCRQHDLGSTPSEIIANDLQRREWNYLWTNFRLYHKYFSTESYAQNVANDFGEMRRFLSLWAFDWSNGELTNDLRLIGTPIPTGSTAADYYTQLTGKFNTDISVANQLAATYHRAIIEQSSGERPFVTSFDPYYGDTTQQGIQIDKITATGSFSQLWPAFSNYDPSQSAGIYLTSFGGQLGDAAYTTVSEQVLADYLGAAYATYQYSQVGPIANFAATTHSPAYTGNLQLRNWVGGWAFNRERDFLDYVHSIAVKYDFPNCDENGNNCQPCTSLDNCTWDPRLQQATTGFVTQSNRYNIFQGPDGHTYIWGYIASRNQWILADRDVNNATYTLMLSWTTDVVNNEDDGTLGASSLEYKVRYIVDAFTYYDGQSLAGQ